MTDLAAGARQPRQRLLATRALTIRESKILLCRHAACARPFASYEDSPNLSRSSERPENRQPQDEAGEGSHA